MSSRKDWRSAQAQMAKPVIDCARCGLAFRQNFPESLLCIGCEAVWIAAGRPEDELPPMSAEHWREITTVDTAPKRRGFTPPRHPSPVEVRTRATNLLCLLTAVAALLLAVTGTSSAAVTRPRPAPCPVTGSGPYQSCVRIPATARYAAGQEITAGTVNPGTPWLVTDHTGAPMAWVNLYGLYSGGDGGKMPGGLICVTDGVWKVVACLTPRGNLMLRDRHGTVTLTARDVRELHKLERRR